MTNLRGALVPVFDLHAIFGHAAAVDRHTQMGLILDKGEHAVAVTVSDYPQVLTDLRPLLELPPLPSALRPFVSTAYGRTESIWVDFDHRRFFQSLSERMAA
jgi:twitching motility protein PilI